MATDAHLDFHEGGGDHERHELVLAAVEGDGVDDGLRHHREGVEGDEQPRERAVAHQLQQRVQPLGGAAAARDGAAGAANGRHRVHCEAPEHLHACEKFFLK